MIIDSKNCHDNFLLHRDIHAVQFPVHYCNCKCYACSLALTHMYKYHILHCELFREVELLGMNENMVGIDPKASQQRCMKGANA